MVDRVKTLLLFLVVLLSSCNDDPVTLKVRPDVVGKGETARKTLLVYMMAENSLSNYASYDVDEIKEIVPYVPRDCRLFVYVDDVGFPLMTQYFRMTNGEAGNSDFVLFDNDVCSSDTATLGAVMDYILKDYPTETFDLVMWSHGSGWLRAPLNSAPHRSIGIDNGNNSYSNDITTTIDMEELAALLERMPVKVDRLMFDACFMQCVESAYALRNAAEWIIASPAEIPGDGALYSTMVPEFFVSEGPQDIIDVYIKAYEKEYTGAVLSAVHAPDMQQLADATYHCVNKYFSSADTRTYSNLFSYLPGGAYYDSNPYPSYYDMNSVMFEYLSPDDYLYWRQAFDKAVPYVSASKRWYSSFAGGHIWGYDNSIGGGVSMYLPQHNSRNYRFNQDFRTTGWYSAAGWDVAGW